MPVRAPSLAQIGVKQPLNKPVLDHVDVIRGSVTGYKQPGSADYAGDTRSAIVDALSTLVTDGTMLKVYAWYDNEMGYACRMVDLACHMDSLGL